MTQQPFFDCHAHTADLSYCCDPGITPQTYADALAAHPEVAGFVITNHGFAAYFPAEIAWKAEFMRRPELFTAFRQYGNARLERHLATLAAVGEPRVLPGMEVEMMYDGRLTLDDKFRPRLAAVIGSVHFLPGVDPKVMSPQQVLDAWWDHTQSLAATGIVILAHPFRWIHKNGGVPVTMEMVQALVELARRNAVALEINAHFSIPGDVDLVRACAQAGVAVAFGTDSHSVSEIGRFEYHQTVLREAGLPPGALTMWAPRRRS